MSILGRETFNCVINPQLEYTKGDSWEDDEFEVPTIQSSITVPTSWDDETDEVIIDEDIVSKPSIPQLVAHKKRTEEKEIVFQTKMKLSMLENETHDEKKLRERKQVEEADTELVGELFAKTSTVKSLNTTNIYSNAGIGSIILKTKQDHINFGSTISKRLDDSSAFNIGAFYKSLSKTLENSTITLEVLDEIRDTITKIRDTKMKDTIVTTKVTTKKSKKEIKKAIEKHNDVFGGIDDIEYHDKYDNLEDQYMF
jgi:hypothetical protein